MFLCQALYVERPQFVRQMNSVSDDRHEIRKKRYSGLILLKFQVVVT